MTSTPRVMIICLGDLGRSPRMQYHALSCLRHGYHVDLIGLNGTDLHPDLQAAAQQTIRRKTQSNNQSNDQSNDQSNNQPNNQSNNQTNNQSNRSNKKSINHLSSISENEQTSPVNNQPNNQSNSQSVLQGDLIVHRFDPPFNYSVADASTQQSNNQSNNQSKISSMLRVPPILLGGIKVILQCYKLSKICLIDCSEPTTILVQNPPSVPTLMISSLISFFKNSNLIIDWHNFGYSILGLVLNKKSNNHSIDHESEESINQSINQSIDPSNNQPMNGTINQSSNRIVQICLLYEKFFGRFGTGHLCVTNSMKGFLMKEWQIAASVLYDRPPANFHRLSINQSFDCLIDLNDQGLVNQSEIDQWLHEINQRRCEHLGLSSINQSNNQSNKQSVLTYFDGKEHQYRADRPALIVSSTSWTADEDFSLFLDALILYDRACSKEYQTTRRSSNQSNNQPNKQSINQSHSRSNKKSSDYQSSDDDQSIDDSDFEFDESINHSINQSMSHSPKQSNNQSINQSSDQSNNQFIVDLLATGKADDLSLANDVLLRKRRKLRSALQSTHQSNNQSINQSNSQSINQSDNQSNIQSSFLPPLLVVITGKGPMLAEFREKIACQNFTHVKILTPFLKFCDYPRILGLADLGVSLHVSSSGLDLPMKVVDMFGCELPVLAVDFPCLGELLGSADNQSSNLSNEQSHDPSVNHSNVVQGMRGYTFNTGDQLYLYLSTLFGQWPNIQTITDMRGRVKEWANVRWDETWDATAHALINPSINQPNQTTNQSTSSSTSHSINQSINQSLSSMNNRLNRKSNSQSKSINQLNDPSNVQTINQLLTSPTLLVSTLFRLFKQLPYHYRSMLIIMVLAMFYHLFVLLAPLIIQSVNRSSNQTVVQSATEFMEQTVIWSHDIWKGVLLDYSEGGIYAVAMTFARSPVASWFVFSLVFGSLFWIAVVYAINQSINQSIDESINGDQSINQSINQAISQSNIPMRAADNVRMIATSSEDEK